MSSQVDKSTIENAVFLLACCGQTRNLGRPFRFVIPKSFGYRLVQIFRLPKRYGREAFGYLLENKRNIILAFKGTGIRLFDLAIDFNLYQTTYPFVKGAGKTHQGFTFLYRLLRERVIAVCQQLAKQQPKRDLYITGYSLGGALATLAALDVTTHIAFRHPKVYTFASPRVGNPTFVNAYNHKVKESIRVVNVHDYIPLEPQTPILPPFTKHGLVYEHVKGYFPISFQCKKGNSPLTFPLLKNHNLDNYFSALAKFAPAYTTRICRENPKFCPSYRPDLIINYRYTDISTSASNPKYW